MPNKKISELTAIGHLSATDVFPVAKSGATYRASIQQILQFVLNANVFSPIGHTHDASDIVSGVLDDARISQSSVVQHQSALSIDWSQLTGVPSSFTPSAHTHDISQITHSFLQNRLIWVNNSQQLTGSGNHYFDGNMFVLGDTASHGSNIRLSIIGGSSISNISSLTSDNVYISGGNVSVGNRVVFKHSTASGFTSGIEWRSETTNAKVLEFIWSQASVQFYVRSYGSITFTPFAIIGGGAYYTPENNASASILTTSGAAGVLTIGGSSVPNRSLNSVTIGNGFIVADKFVATGYGSTLPTQNISGGLFYKTGAQEGLYINTGSQWNLITSSFEITDTINFTAFPDTYIQTYAISGYGPSGVGMRFVLSGTEIYRIVTAPSFGARFNYSLTAPSLTAWNTSSGSHVTLHTTVESSTDFADISVYRSGWLSTAAALRFAMPTASFNTAYGLFTVPVVMSPSGTNPGSTVEGALYYNTVSKSLRIYSNNTWSDICGNVINTGNLKHEINRSQFIPLAGSPNSMPNKFATISIVDEADTYQGLGMMIFSRGDLTTLALGRFENTLMSPGTTSNGESVARIVFFGAANNAYSDFIRLVGKKINHTSGNVCYGHFEIGVRNASGVYHIPFSLRQDGILLLDCQTPISLTPLDTQVYIGRGTVYAGTSLVIKNLSSLPSTTVVSGALANHNNELKFYNGSSWITLSGSGSGGSIGDTIETGNLRSEISRSSDIQRPTTTHLPNKFPSIAEASIADSDQSPGLFLAAKNETSCIVLAQYNNTLSNPTNISNNIVGRIVFSGSSNAMHSDFVSISGVKAGNVSNDANSPCYGSLVITQRYASNSTLQNVLKIDHDGMHTFYSPSIDAPLLSPTPQETLIKGGYVIAGKGLKVLSSYGHTEIAERTSPNGTQINIVTNDYTYGQIRFCWGNVNNQKGALEVDNSSGQISFIGGWDSDSYMRFRVGQNLNDVMRVYGNYIHLGYNVSGVYIVFNPSSSLPTVPSGSTALIVHIDNGQNRLKFFNGSSWITIA